jgi:hypothetical protein
MLFLLRTWIMGVYMLVFLMVNKLIELLLEPLAYIAIEFFLKSH